MGLATRSTGLTTMQKSLAYFNYILYITKNSVANKKSTHGKAIVIYKLQHTYFSMMNISQPLESKN